MSIASEITRLQQAKADIKSAIEGKGVTVPSDATLDAYDGYIDDIPSGGGGDEALKKLIEGTAQDLVIPDGTTRIMGYAFYYKHLSSLTIPSSVIAFPAYALAYIGDSSNRIRSIIWKNPNVTLPTNNSYLFTNIYPENGNLDNFLPQGCVRFGTAWFQRVYYSDLVTIPERITQIDSANFQSVSTGFELQFLSSTPPTLSSTTALGSTSASWLIYVPDSSVSAYQSASNWVGYASRIKGISERPTT